MNTAIVLIVVGIVLAFLVNYLLGIVLVVAGCVVLLMNASGRQL